MYIVFDIGGTKMRFAALVDGGISEPIVIKTPNSYVEAMAEISEIFTKLSKGQKIKCIAGGVAGVLSRDGKKLLIAPNLKSWVGKPLAEDLSRLSGAKVLIKNDADMVALGEATHGAGVDHRVVAYLTFSTGIGGSLVIAKDLLSYNFGFEPGFQIIDSQNKRHLHSIAGTELKEKYGLLFRDVKDEKVRKEILADVIAGIHNTIIFWSPDVVVLGGGMTESFVIDDIKNELSKFTFKFPEIPAIKLAELGDFGGLYGSMEFLKKHYDAK
jgi:predicted NBD/HSP70 family sugar kinase